MRDFWYEISDPGLESFMTSFIATLRAQVGEGKKALIDQFKNASPTTSAALRLLRGLSKHVDASLVHLWRELSLQQGAALVAVGGYGRGELFPSSDVDVLIVLAEPLNIEESQGTASISQRIEAFITACWDIGLEIGSSVRTLPECLLAAHSDITIQTALLESRFICGSQSIYRAFAEQTKKYIDPKDFFVAKSLEMRQRHARFEETPYSLEPNCKESPGGLRDLQVLVWVARAANLGRNWAEMAQHGLATPFEAKQLQRNEELLKLIRCLLHIISGRQEDRLLFDLQTTVAQHLGYVHTKEQRASEALMHAYYWAAKAVTQLNQILMLNIQERIHGEKNPPLRMINDRFWDRDGMLEVVSDDLYRRDPTAILETFLTFQQEVGIEGLSAKTLRALYNARHLMGATFRHDPRNRMLFMQILQAPSGQTHVFRLLNQTSVLGRYLWVFRRIVGKMQHDLFHVYTVDQHILMVLRNVRRFFIPEHAHEYPFCSQLAAQWDKPWILYVAALFHDVAKGRGGDHSDLGAIEARRFCRNHGIDKEDAQLIEFLVQHHLTMSRVAQKEDLSDPEVIGAFAKLVVSERSLNALYLLTVADIRGTSPKVWNAWKGKLLEDLYHLTLRALGGAKPNIAATMETRKQAARRILALHCMPTGAENALWQTLQVSYFARHDAVDIAWHAHSLVHHLDTTEPLVRARLSSVGEGLQILVYSLDRADLFARICGYFDSAEFNILDAKVHTTAAGFALDTFQIFAPHTPAAPELYDRMIPAVQQELMQAINGQSPLPEPIQSRPSRRVRSFPITPRINLRPDERAQRWLLTVTASDRSGLLYSIACVLARHQINLQLAKVTTLGERIEDTFLINGDALQNNRLRLTIETELLAVIGS